MKNFKRFLLRNGLKRFLMDAHLMCERTEDTWLADAAWLEAIWKWAVHDLPERQMA